jgi:predicted nucleic acid-binding protein
MKNNLKINEIDLPALKSIVLSRSFNSAKWIQDFQEVETFLKDLLNDQLEEKIIKKGEKKSKDGSFLVLSTSFRSSRMFFLGQGSYF